MVSLYEEDYNENAPHVKIESVSIEEEEQVEPTGNAGRTISASVGRNGVNRYEDVLTIQQMLNMILAYQGGPVEQLDEDGKSGRNTIAAIEKFQRFIGIQPDGRVDPNGGTLAALNAVRVMLGSDRGKKAAAQRKEQDVAIQ